MKTATLNRMTSERFELGRLMMTPAARDTVPFEAMMFGLQQHAACNWGHCDAHDSAMNDRAIKNGDRILSVYGIPGTGAGKGPGGTTGEPDKFWIITDAADDDGKRHSTTVLLPSDY